MSLRVVYAYTDPNYQIYTQREDLNFDSESTRFIQVQTDQSLLEYFNHTCVNL